MSREIKRGRGRPRKKDAARLTMLIKYTAEQRANWRRKAEKAGMPVGTWLKQLADAIPG